MRLWDAESGAALSEPLVGHGGSVSCVSLSESTGPSMGRLEVASGSADNVVRLWDAETTDRAPGDQTTGMPSFALKPTSRLRWASRARAQTLDATGLALSPSLDCGLQPHQLKLLQHFGLRSAGDA